MLYMGEIAFSAGANIIFLFIITITITVIRLWHALIACLFLLLQHSEQIVRAELEKERERHRGGMRCLPCVSVLHIKVMSETKCWHQIFPLHDGFFGVHLDCMKVMGAKGINLDVYPELNCMGASKQPFCMMLWCIKSFEELWGPGSRVCDTV